MAPVQADIAVTMAWLKTYFDQSVAERSLELVCDDSAGLL